MPRRIDHGARQAQLAEAVWRVILTHGVSAVSVRNVAEEADVVVGSLRHLFPTRTELLTFSAQLMVQRVRDRVDALPARSDPRDRAFDVLTQLLPLDPLRRAELEVNVALMAEGAAEPALLPIRDEAHAAIADGCVRLAEQLTIRPGEPDTLNAARRLHALTDGLAVHLLHQADDEDPAWALEILRHEIETIARTPSD